MKKLLFLLIILSIPLFITSCGKDKPVATVGQPAPDFTLVDLTGKSWKLSELKGHVVFVNFWATWCSPCVREMPSMQKLYTMMPTSKFKMLAVLINDDPAIAKNFARQFGITLPILDDNKNTVAPKYGITGVPETFIIDKQGILRAKFLGPAEWDSPAVTGELLKFINQ
jgi:peroxiredoxin